MLWKIFQIGLFVVAAEFLYRPDATNNPLAIGLFASTFVILMTHLVYWCFWPFEWVKRVIERGRRVREVEEAAHPSPRRTRLPWPYSP
jgi:CBS domain containing-hemolysin-like protein